MKRLILFLLMFITISCGVCKRQYIPVETRVDSVYIEKIVERLDTVKFYLPGEKIDVVRQDSSHLETTVAISDAVVDSLGFLHHTLENKKVALKKEIVYKDRVIEKMVDVEKEVPVEVEVPVRFVPGYYKWINGLFWGLIGLMGLLIGLRLYFRR